MQSQGHARLEEEALWLVSHGRAAHTEPERSRTKQLTSDSGKCPRLPRRLNKKEKEKKGGEEKGDERRRRRKRFNTAGASWRLQEDQVDGWMDVSCKFHFHRC